MRKSEVVLSLALATSFGTSLWLWHELHLERELRAKAEIQAQVVAAAPAGIRPADTQAVAPAANAEQVRPSTPPAANTPANPPVVNAGPPPQVDEQAAQLRLLKDPRYRAAWREEYRLNLGLRRENIIRLVGLTPEQADAVIDLQIDRLLTQMEDPRALNEHYAANEQAHQAKLGELLGPQKSARLQEYMESRPTRVQVDQLRNLLGGTDTLRDDQVEPLITALHTENSQFRQQLDEYRREAQWSQDPSAWRQFEERRAGLEQETQVRLRAAAAPILSSTQLEKFDDMLERGRARRAAEQRMEGLQAKIGGKPPSD